MATLDSTEIDPLIHSSTFHDREAVQIRNIAQQVVGPYGGEQRCERKLIMPFRGVGPKGANLASGIACGEQVISVDVHVHRVTNRWGYVTATTPERTLAELEKTQQKEHWLNINRLLVPFGKHVCTGQWPKCSTWAVLNFCQQIRVTTHR
jgi:endonuclease III